MKTVPSGHYTSDVLDTFGRPLKSLRLSVTDRCNLRCKYCMPEEEYTWLPRETLLTFEEIEKLVLIFSQIGVDKLRLTGGEPLLRRDLPVLIQLLKRNGRIKDIALTTNGILLEEQADELYQSGLNRITVSLDTLKPDRFKMLTRRETFDRVKAGIAAVNKVGFEGLKLDTVALRGFNEDELADLIEYGKSVDAEVRFIEYMDVGGANDWSMDKVLSQADILLSLTQRYGPIEPMEERGAAPAQRFLMQDGTTFGIIPSTTSPFCAACDRCRLTADGLWFLCLYAKTGTDLRQPLRAGASLEHIKSLICSGWNERLDRGAEERKALEALNNRGRFIEIENLRKDPHLEMHARGG